MKRLLCSTFIVGSLVLAGSAAMAGTAHIHKVVWPDVDYSTLTAYPAGVDRHAFGFMFAGPAHGAAPLLSSSASEDTSPPIDYSAQQSAQQATDAANQQMMLNSMQATQEANDEANAAVTAGILAAQQTEINANNDANNPNN